MHPRNFGSHVTVRPPALLTDRPSAPQAYQCKITQSTGIATQGFIWKETAWLPGLLERKKQQLSRVFFDDIFDVYTQVDNKERARESD